MNNTNTLESVLKNLLLSTDYLSYKKLHDEFLIGLKELEQATLFSEALETTLTNINAIIRNINKAILYNESKTFFSALGLKSTDISLLSKVLVKLDQKIPIISTAIMACDAFFSLQCSHPEAFNYFTLSLLDSFTEHLDQLVNSKDHASLMNTKVQLIELTELMKLEDRNTVLVTLKQRAAEFINLVNDPTSSYSLLNDQLTSSIVVAITDIELSLNGNKISVPVLDTVKDTVVVPSQVVEELANTTPDVSQYNSFNCILESILATKPKSKLRSSKIAFFSYYLSKVEYEVYNKYLTETSSIILTADEETTNIINKLYL